MKRTVWLVLAGGALAIAVVSFGRLTSAPTPPAVDRHEVRKALVSQQGQARHWRACVMQSR